MTAQWLMYLEGRGAHKLISIVQALSEIKMIRVYLTNFSEPVTLRLVDFYIAE
jgi:hypothetical protein